jgi:sRNA-binding carbon storage regulator CsrA
MRMLSLTVKIGAPVRLTIGDQTAWVMVSDIDRGTVRLAFDAPLSVDIKRDELLPISEQYATVTRDRRIMGDV